MQPVAENNAGIQYDLYRLLTGVPLYPWRNNDKVIDLDRFCYPTLPLFIWKVIIINKFQKAI